MKEPSAWEALGRIEGALRSLEMKFVGTNKEAIEQIKEIVESFNKDVLAWRKSKNLNLKGGDLMEITGEETRGYRDFVEAETWLCESCGEAKEAKDMSPDSDEPLCKECWEHYLEVSDAMFDQWREHE